jgi:hypothetical protein
VVVVIVLVIVVVVVVVVGVITQNKRIHTQNIYALCGIGNHDPGFRANALFISAKY